MITGSPTPISGLPTGTIDNMQAIFPMDIGMPSLPQTIQGSLEQIAQFLQSQGQMISGSYTLLDGRYQPTDGWISDENTWTFASADDPSYVASVNANITGTIGLGTKISLTQHSTVKNFIATQVTLSGSNTYINLYGGTDYDLSSSGTITNPKYSYQYAPFGFPRDNTKWDWNVTNSTNYSKSIPSGSVWYGETHAPDSGSLPDIDVPIGLWGLGFKAIGRVQTTTSLFSRIDLTLSTYPSSESDADLSVGFSLNAGFDGGGNLVNLPMMISYPKVINLTAKTRYYLLMKTTSVATTIQVQGVSSTTILRAKCMYL